MPQPVSGESTVLVIQHCVLMPTQLMARYSVDLINKSTLSLLSVNEIGRGAWLLGFCQEVSITVVFFFSLNFATPWGMLGGFASSRVAASLLSGFLEKQT